MRKGKEKLKESGRRGERGTSKRETSSKNNFEDGKELEKKPRKMAGVVYGRS
jgi:hypothetical protein